MGIAYPPELELHRLGPPPGVHAPFDLSGAIESFILPSRQGISMAGRRLRVGPNEDVRTVARDLRALLIDRFHDRRPDADHNTWVSFVSIVHGMLRDEQMIDPDLRHSLLAAIDGL